MNCDNLISKNNEQDDIFQDLINFLDPNSWNIEEVVVPWLSAEEKLRKFSKVFHHKISSNEFRDYVENVLQNCSNLAKAEVPSSVQKAKNIISAIAVSSAETERGFSKMNIVYLDKRSRLTVENVANLMIINLIGLPFSTWEPTPSVKKWLRRNHSADRRRRRRLKSIHSRSDTNRNGAEGLSFYYTRLLHCLDQMLAGVVLSQHRVSLSKTFRHRAPCGARCIGHAVSTWSAVCSEAPHSQFGEGARPHLCMDEWNRPTPVPRRWSLTQAARGNPIPTGLAPVPGTKTRRLEAPSQYSVFHL